MLCILFGNPVLLIVTLLPRQLIVLSLTLMGVNGGTMLSSKAIFESSQRNRECLQSSLSPASFKTSFLTLRMSLT